MHDQAYLRKRVLAKYHNFLQAWLTGETDFFPLSFSVGQVDVKDYQALDSYRATLTQHAKSTLGYGYIIDSDTRRTRQLGEQTIPHHIVFENAEDYLRYIGKAKWREFQDFVADVKLIRAHQPSLENWLYDNITSVLKYHGVWTYLLRVCAYFVAHPQPQLYSRELPIEVHTKFIEQHQNILDKLLQQVLPASAYDLTTEDFNTRYGIRNKVPLIRIRFLDNALKAQNNIPFDDFAIPLNALQDMPLVIERCFIVENELNFLTLPSLKNSMCIWGAGFQANLLGDVQWLNKVDVIYWGDIDVQGFQILSTLRAKLPHVRSMLMDRMTFDSFQSFVVTGNSTSVTALFNLTSDERGLYQYLLDNTYRLEQEHIDQDWLHSALEKL